MMPNHFPLPGGAGEGAGVDGAEDGVRVKVETEVGAMVLELARDEEGVSPGASETPITS